ncbi:hypothetical protein FRC11_006437 [Ceratobasidium sp. 423]|nr:hypothetical protein FRC11_006437 [Ceratobasidium sp. 423]
MKDRDHWDTKNIQLPLSQKQIEHGLAHLTILQASGTFADWNSVAYHGLVDLRLTPGCEKWDASIKECDLIAILKASPGLRIFHFALQLKKVSPIDSSVQPIVLNDLEVLDVSAYSNSHPRDTLPEVASAIQLITPGSKSLRLTIQTNNYTGLPALDAVKQFFLRSRISKFCTRKGCPPPRELLLCAPDLVQLVFDRCTYSAQFNQEQMDQNHISDSPLRLYSWHIRGSSIYLDDFHSLIRQYPTRSLVISQCRVYRRTGAPEELPRVALSVHLPGTRFVTQEDLQPDPTADWNDLD